MYNEQRAASRGGDNQTVASAPRLFLFFCFYTIGRGKEKGKKRVYCERPQCSISKMQKTSLTEQHLPGVLDELLDLHQESDGLPSVEETVIIGQSEVHHLDCSLEIFESCEVIERAYWSDLDLAVHNDGLVLDGVETEDSSLGQVDDRGSHQATEDTTVADGEGTSSHVFDGELVVPGFPTEIRNGLLDLNHVLRLGVTDDGGNQTLLGGNSHGDVDVIAVDDGVTTVWSLDGCVDSRDLLHGENAGAGEGRHETKLDTLLLENFILVQFAEFHDGRHVNLVEGGQGSCGVLRLLETLGNSEAHAVHLDASLLAVTGRRCRLGFRLLWLLLFGR